MNLISVIKRNFCKKKVVTAVLITASVAAFATLGDGSYKRTPTPKQSLLAFKPNYDYKNFSLKSTYKYRGNNVFSLNKPETRYVMMNTVVTYQKGNATYTLPIKKKVLLNKVKLGNVQNTY